MQTPPRRREAKRRAKSGRKTPKKLAAFKSPVYMPYSQCRKCGQPQTPTRRAKNRNRRWTAENRRGRRKRGRRRRAAAARASNMVGRRRRSRRGRRSAQICLKSNRRLFIVEFFCFLASNDCERRILLATAADKQNAILSAAAPPFATHNVQKLTTSRCTKPSVCV